SGETPRISAKRCSKSASGRVPVSRPMSRSRLARSVRKRSPMASGDRLSAAQKARNDANRSVVITPPQSTRSPVYLTLEPVPGVLQRALGQLDDALAERLQPRV